MLTEEQKTEENIYNKKIIEIEQKLKNYLLENYDLNIPKISLKFKHTFKTKDFNEKIVKSLNLSPRDAYISNIVALFHDYGRFAQIKNYNTFNDLASVDHADLGIKMLFDNNELCNFINDLTDEELEIVKQAIKYHNKYVLEEGLTDRQKLFCNIIRDADKVDIFRILSENPYCDGLKIGKLEKEDLDNFYDHKLYRLRQEKNFYTEALLHISYVYDLNFSMSCKIIDETNSLKMYIYNVLLFTNFKVDKKLLSCFEYIQRFLKVRASEREN